MEKMDIEILKRQGFFLIRKLGDGTYIAQHRNTTYYGLYVVVRQK